MKNNGTKRKSGKKPLLREEINRRGFSEKKLEAEIELKRMMQKKKKNSKRREWSKVPDTADTLSKMRNKKCSLDLVEGSHHC